MSISILRLANLGISIVAFLRQTSELLLDFSGCDALGISATDGALYYQCEATKRPERATRFQTLAPDSSRHDELGADADGSEVLNSLCEDVMHGRFDPSSPLLTKNGSFCVGDATRSYPYSDGPGSRAAAIPLSQEYNSLAIVPFVIDDQNNGVLILKNIEPSLFTEEDIELYEGIAQNVGAAIAARRTRSEYYERVKELSCLYGIAQIASQTDVSTEEALLRIAGLLPPAWQYPDLTCARIDLDGRSYSTPGFEDGKHRQSAEIAVEGKPRGRVEVVYTDERPTLYEGPFLKEERHLIDAVAVEVAQIIEKREAEEYRSRLQDQLRHADRLATIGQLAAGVAHELNEPLSAILGFAQLAKKAPDVPQETNQDLDKMISACLHAREVVKKLLIFARQMPTERSLVSLNALVGEELYFLESRCAKEQIKLIRELDPELPEVYADPGQMHQILVNLVVNAIQAMPDGGKLTLKTKKEGEKAVLIVEDTGVGMGKEALEKMFLPFFTTKDVGQGTGLGLPVVHGIVTSHGGTISVESEPGKGSRFKVTLPPAGPEEDKVSE